MPVYKVPGYAVVTGPLAGTVEWVKQANLPRGGALWNNGHYVMRNIRGTGSDTKRGQISNHARGVAMDLSYRHLPANRKGIPNGRIKTLTWLNTVLDNYQLLGVQCVLDYAPADFGRGWRVDRVEGLPKKAHNHQAWVSYARPTIHGAPGGDWLHIEITLGMANNAERVKTAFAEVFKQSTTTEQPLATVADTTKGGQRRGRPRGKKPTT